MSAPLASANLFGTHTHVSQHDNASPGSNNDDDDVEIQSDRSSDYVESLLYTHSHISQHNKACPGLLTLMMMFIAAIVTVNSYLVELGRPKTTG